MEMEGWGGWWVGGLVGVGAWVWVLGRAGVAWRFRDVDDQKTRSIMCRSEPVG